jgi:hypothetical protein
MMEMARDAFLEIAPDKTFGFSDSIGTGSTDMGDLSCIMPVVHPYAPGVSGRSHGSDYEVTDAETACVLNAKWQVNMASLLLRNNAERARKIIAEYKPLFESKEAYLSYVDALNSSSERITYNEDGTAFVITE